MGRYEDTLPTSYSYKGSERRMRIYLRRSRGVKLLTAAVVLSLFMVAAFFWFRQGGPQLVVVHEPLLSEPTPPSPPLQPAASQAPPTPEPEPARHPEPIVPEQAISGPGSIDPYINMVSVIGLQLVKPLIGDTKNYLLDTLMPIINTLLPPKVLEDLMESLAALHRHELDLLDFVQKSILPLMQNLLKLVQGYSPETGEMACHAIVEICDGMTGWAQTSNPSVFLDVLSSEVSSLACSVAGLNPRQVPKVAAVISNFLVGLLPDVKELEQLNIHDLHNTLHHLIPSHFKLQTMLLTLVSSLMAIRAEDALAPNAPPDTPDRDPKSKKSRKRKARTSEGDERGDFQ